MMELFQSLGRQKSVAPSTNSIKYQSREVRERETVFIGNEGFQVENQPIELDKEKV